MHSVNGDAPVWMGMDDELPPASLHEAGPQPRWSAAEITLPQRRRPKHACPRMCCRQDTGELSRVGVFSTVYARIPNFLYTVFCVRSGPLELQGA